jgi:hypothetical protein
LDEGEVVMHPFVLGELALGHLHPRQSIIADLLELPTIHVADPEEVLLLIERQELVAVGLGYIDVHLLAATAATDGCRLWTRDKRMDRIATRLGIAADPLN